MSASRKMLDRPLPSLAQWLGDGSRADVFEAWVKESTAMAAAALDDRSAAMARIMQTLSIAMVESGRIETEQHGRGWADVMVLQARVAGALFMVMLAHSASRAGDLPTLEAIFATQFREGMTALREQVQS